MVWTDEKLGRAWNTWIPLKLNKWLQTMKVSPEQSMETHEFSSSTWKLSKNRQEMIARIKNTFKQMK